jgi:hypothetical protein
MTTIFMTAPFRRFALGDHAFLTPSGHPRMAQGFRSLVSDVLKDVGVTEADINNLINKLPSDAAGPYKAQLDDCKRKGLTTAEGAACAYALYQAIREGKPVTSGMPAPMVVQQPSSFPIVPVVLGVAATGALIYFLTKK